MQRLEEADEVHTSSRHLHLISWCANQRRDSVSRDDLISAHYSQFVQMITGMAVTVVDPEEMWKIPRRGHEDEAP